MSDKKHADLQIDIKAIRTWRALRFRVCIDTSFMHWYPQQNAELYHPRAYETRITNA
jgi:hypothetical protein